MTPREALAPAAAGALLGALIGGMLWIWQDSVLFATPSIVLSAVLGLLIGPRLGTRKISIGVAGCIAVTLVLGLVWGLLEGVQSQPALSAVFNLANAVAGLIVGARVGTVSAAVVGILLGAIIGGIVWVWLEGADYVPVIIAVFSMVGLVLGARMGVQTASAALIGGVAGILFGGAILVWRGGAEYASGLTAALAVVGLVIGARLGARTAAAGLMGGIVGTVAGGIIWVWQDGSAYTPGLHVALTIVGMVVGGRLGVQIVGPAMAGGVVGILIGGVIWAKYDGGIAITALDAALGVSGLLIGAMLRTRIWHYIQISGTFFSRQPLGAFGATAFFLILVCAVYAPLIATDDPRSTNVKFVFAPPGPDVWLGGDQLGRDVYSRLVHGAVISMRVGILSVTFGITAGFFLGIISAYLGGWLDLLFQRVVDAVQAFPFLLLALAIVAARGGSESNVIIALTVVFIPGAARTIRSQALSIKETDYVLAARAVGANPFRIILCHISPNCIATYIVLATLTLGIAIIAEASLSFLGVGIPPDIPSWGGMLTGAAQNYVEVAPWLGVFPGLIIAIVVFSANLLGDSLRDVLDPRLRGSR